MLEECETSSNPAVQERCLQTVQGRLKLARNSAIVPEIQALLVRDDDWQVRWGLAQNRDIVPEIQALLVRDDNSDVRRELAWNSALIRDLQAILARDDDSNVRRGLAWNSAIVPEVQTLLARDNNLDVRRGLAENPALIRDLQAHLARDDNPNVRWHLAMNPALTDPLARGILRRRGDDPIGPKCAADASSWGRIAQAQPEDQEMALAEGFAHCPESFVDAGWQWWQQLTPAEREQHASLHDELMSRGTLATDQGGPILL